MRRQSQLDDIYGVKSIQTNPLEKDNDVPETGFRHSDGYHRFFRGYTEIRVQKPNGRFQIQRYYTQPWIVSAGTGKEYWLKRVLLVLLAAASWAAYVWSMCLPLGSNRWWATAIPGLAGVIGLLVLSAVVLCCIFAPRKMTLWDHASTSKRLKVMSALTGGCMALAALAKLLYLVLHGGTEELYGIAGTAVAAACAAGIHILERKTVYTTVPNDTVLPEGEAHEIW